jgi:hypothetical protein
MKRLQSYSLHVGLRRAVLSQTVIAAALLLIGGPLGAQRSTAIGPQQRITLTETAAVTRVDTLRDSRGNFVRTQITTTLGSTTTTTRAIGFDAVLLDRLLANFQLSEDQRNDMIEAVGQLLKEETVTRSSIVAALQARGQIPIAAAEVLADLILQRPKNSSATFLSAVTASGNTDRLYAAVDVVRFSRPLLRGAFEARIVTGVAVSNADSTAKTTAATEVQQADYRTRTADLLTALREGGPVALLVAYDFHPPKVLATSGWDAALALSAAQGGKRPGVENGRGTGGVTLEIKGFLKDDLKNPTQLMGTARVGVRYAPDGILLEIDKNVLKFGQLTIEFKPPASTVPIGVAFTWVNEPFKSYSRTVQFFGIAGF